MNKLIVILILILLSYTVANAEYVKVWDKLNVRASANISGQIIDTLPRGQLVVVQSKKDGWAHIKYVSNQQYRYGWVKDEFLTEDLVFTSTDPKKLAYLKDLEELKNRLKEKYKAKEKEQKLLIEREYQLCMDEVFQREKCLKDAENCYWNSGLTISECKRRGFDKNLCPDATFKKSKCNEKRIFDLLSIGNDRALELLGETRLLQKKYNIKFEPIYEDVINVRIVN